MVQKAWHRIHYKTQSLIQTFIRFFHNGSQAVNFYYTAETLRKHPTPQAKVWVQVKPYLSVFVYAELIFCWKTWRRAGWVQNVLSKSHLLNKGLFRCKGKAREGLGLVLWKSCFWYTCEILLCFFGKDKIRKEYISLYKFWPWGRYFNPAGSGLRSTLVILGISTQLSPSSRYPSSSIFSTTTHHIFWKPNHCDSP